MTLFTNTYYFYGLAAGFTILATWAINKIPALKNGAWSKSLPLVFGRTISIQVGIGCLCLLLQAVALGTISDLFTDGYTFLLKGTSIAGIAMVVENLVKALFSKEYSANIKIMNLERFKEINELLTANYSGYSKLNWMQKLGIIVAIDLDISNLPGEIEDAAFYENFKKIFSEYINIEYLECKIKELFDLYKQEKNQEIETKKKENIL